MSSHVMFLTLLSNLSRITALLIQLDSFTSASVESGGCRALCSFKVSQHSDLHNHFEAGE